MRDLELFSRALGLQEPWRVVETSFDAGQRRLDLRLDFEPGARFGCPVCERSGCAVHDTSEKSWRHLDFFQQQAYLKGAGAAGALPRAWRAPGRARLGARGVGIQVVV